MFKRIGLAHSKTLLPPTLFPATPYLHISDEVYSTGEHEDIVHIGQSLPGSGYNSLAIFRG